MDIFSQLKEAIAEAERQAQVQVEEATAALKPPEPRRRRRQAPKPEVRQEYQENPHHRDPAVHNAPPPEPVGAQPVTDDLLADLHRFGVARAFLVKEVFDKPLGLRDDGLD